MEDIVTNIKVLEKKVDMILQILQNDVKPECKKMSDHINFIETVYDNVKSPMNFICNKFNEIRSEEYLCCRNVLQEKDLSPIDIIEIDSFARKTTKTSTYQLLGVSLSMCVVVAYLLTR